MSTTMFVRASFLSMLLLCFGSCSEDDSNIYPYQVAHFEQYVDHFNQQSYKDKTYQQRYFYSDKNWTPGSGPILFCTGNEGPMELIWETFGFIHELASEMKALEIFAEHRFFGSSLPFGKDSLTAPNIGLLSMEQAMADYAVLISHILLTYNCTDCKVITVGGSYGGMLAAYMRLKYPDIVTGALASSAPVYLQDSAAKRDFFYPRVTKDYLQASELCVERAIQAFAMTKQLAEEEGGLKKLSNTFKLCEPLENQEDYIYFLGWLRKAFVILAIMDFPYKLVLMENLPAYPVNASCKAMNAAKNPFDGLRDLVAVYYNNSKAVQCFNMSALYVPCADPIGCLVGPDATGWDYLLCTDIRMPDSSNGVTDMFPNPPLDDHMRDEHCLKTFGVKPRRHWTSVQFWGKHLKAASNIIFSNGELDPYGGGGVLEDVSDTVVAILIKGAPHEADLLPSNKEDTPGMTEARQKEREIIRKWIGN